jgi:dTDP-4-amino-4,6-dideoxygalactose transaminase
MRIQAPYRDRTVLGGEVATELADRVLCIPCSAHLDRSQQDEIIETVTDTVQRG